MSKNKSAPSNKEKQDKQKAKQLKKREADANRVKSFFTNIVDELKKVTWPTRGETIKLTSIVIVVSLIIGVYIGIIDVLFAKGLEFLISS